MMIALLDVARNVPTTLKIKLITGHFNLGV